MSGSSPETSAVIALNRTALQSLYYAVTGKTENISKVLRGNVLITHSDFQQLYYKLNQSIHVYPAVTEPSVSIVVKKSTSESVQYSSWERFCEFQLNSTDVTSEVSIRLELLLKLPLTEHPQRCSVNASLDSGLPIIAREPGMTAGPFAEFVMLFAYEKYRTVSISVDFVDFIVAKVLVGVIEEWFASLDGIPRGRLTSALLRNSTTITHAAKPVWNAWIGCFSVELRVVSSRSYRRFW